MCNEAGREKMAGRMKWMSLAAGAVMVGAAAFAAQGGFVGNGGGEARPMVQLPPAAPAAKASTSAASAPAAASLSATVGGYTYDWTALQEIGRASCRERVCQYV